MRKFSLKTQDVQTHIGSSRLPLTEKLTLEATGSEFENETGLSCRVLMDLQRLLACACVGHPPRKSFSKEECEQFKAAVGGSSKYSARINLLFRSNAQLRTGRLALELEVWEQRSRTNLGPVLFFGVVAAF